MINQEGEAVPAGRSDENTVTIPASELEALRAQIAFSDLENRLYASVKARFAWIGIAIGLAGIIGINVLGGVMIDFQLKPELAAVTKATAKAEAEAALASRTVAEVTTASKKAIKASNEATKKATAAASRAEKKAVTVSVRIEKIENEIEATSTRARRF